MSYLKSATKVKVLNLIPKPDDVIAQTAADIAIGTTSVILNLKFDQREQFLSHGIVDPSSLPYKRCTAEVNNLFQNMVRKSNGHFENCVLKQPQKTKEEKKKDKQEKRKAEKKERKQQNAASGASQSSGCREPSTASAEPYVVDGTKVAEDYARTYIVGGDHPQKDYAANSFANFVYYVAATMLQCAPKNGQPKRVILPIRELVTKGSDTDRSIYNLALEIREPNDDWQREELFKSDKPYKPWTEEPFDKVLGSAVVANDDGKCTIDELHDKQNELTKRVCGRQFRRRFVWGFVARGSKVEIKRSGYMFTSMTNAFDITTPEGREFLVEFLINMSYCEEHKLGFDPTVKYLPDLKCWQVAVPDKGKERLFYGFQPFHFRVYKSENGFSKYMIAKATKPALTVDGAAPKYQISQDDVTIKDVWKVEDETDAVKRALGDVANSNIDAKFLAGGVVQVDGHDDSPVYILGKENAAADGDKELYIHQRIAIQGVVEIHDKRDEEFTENKHCLKV